MNETKKHGNLKIAAIILMILLVAGGIAVLIAGMMQFKMPAPAEAVPEEIPAAVIEEEVIPEPPAAQEPEKEPAPEEEEPAAPEEPAVVYEPAQKTEQTRELDLQVYSESALLIDCESNTVLSEKNPDAVIYPASMTKVLTLLVAAESIEDPEEKVRITQEMIDRVYLADLTMAGFVDAEEVPLRDLLYGVILPSGAEATAAVESFVAGSEEEFVKRMNEKAAALGLTAAHFADASGMHNENHVCTMQDMAIIMRAALENELCREILSAVSYTSAPTEQHPDGVQMTDKFLARLETQELSGAEILSAKTGYTAQAGNCCVSFGKSPSGRACICVTANAYNLDFVIKDHIALYSLYAD